MTDRPLPYELQPWCKKCQKKYPVDADEWFDEWGWVSKHLYGQASAINNYAFCGTCFKQILETDRILVAARSTKFEWGTIRPFEIPCAYCNKEHIVQKSGAPDPKWGNVFIVSKVIRSDGERLHSCVKYYHLCNQCIVKVEI